MTFARIALFLCIAALVAIGASSCDANFSSIYRTTGGDHSHIAYTDAKQSATVIQVDKDGVMRACAARSPDVLAALSTAGSASGNLSQGQLSLGLAGAGASAESVASFGLRTQLTQTQIELLYQLCIEALNGKITNDQLATELHRYQNTMVSMLAIEQLTGYAKPSIVAVGGYASTGATKDLLELQKMNDTARDAVAKAQAKSQDADATAQTKKLAADKAKADLDKLKQQTPPAPAADLKTAQDASDKANAELTAAQKAQNDAKASLADAQKNQDVIAATLKKAQSDLDTAAGSSAPQFNNPSSSFYVSASADAAKEIAAAVRDIQQTQLWQSFVTDDCLRFLLHGRDTDFPLEETKKSDLYDFCKKQIETAADWRLKKLYLSYGCDPEGKNCPRYTLASPPINGAGGGNLGPTVLPPLAQPSGLGTGGSNIGPTYIGPTLQ